MMIRNEKNSEMTSRKWQDWKNSVGMAVQAEKVGKGMSVEDVLLNCKNTGFDNVVCQTEIQTAEDVERYRAAGYVVALTESQFSERFQIDPKCMFYSSSISLMNFYFNPETLAACPFHIEMYLAGERGEKELSPIWGPESVYKAIAARENEVANGEYIGSIITLTDKMRLEYMRMLLSKKAVEDIPDFYELFTSIYTTSDYGFGEVDSDLVNAAVSAKTYAQKKETAARLTGFPDKITVYRGGGSLSTPFDKAYSWTLDPRIANFFAIKNGTDAGYFVVGQVSKEDIIEYFNDSSEEEILVPGEKVIITEVIPLYGLSFIAETLPEVRDVYLEYKNRMKRMVLFSRGGSAIHGISHQARVLLLSLIIAHMKGLPKRDWRVLAEAAIYHDTRRTHDGVDSEHGLFAKEYYMETVSKADPLVAHLCEYHCMKDEDGYTAIYKSRQLSKNRSRSKLLYDIFKDADALDRVRLGLRDMDIRMLRTDEAKTLTLVAKLCMDHIEI